MTPPPHVDSSWQLARARENLAAGAALLTATNFNAAASRFYYALYHAAWFLLARNGQDAKRMIESRRDDPDAKDSWPHKYLKTNIGLIVQSIRKPLPEQTFRRRLDENYKKFYTHRVAADYLKSGVTAKTLQEDSAELRRLVEDLLAP